MRLPKLPSRNHTKRRHKVGDPRQLPPPLGHHRIPGLLWKLPVHGNFDLIYPSKGVGTNDSNLEMSRDGASLNQYRSSCDSAGVAAAPPSRGCPVLMVPARTALESSGIGLKTICPVHQWTNLLAMFASTDCRATASKGMRELRCHLFALPSSPCNLAVWPVVFLWCLKRPLTHFPRHPPRRFDLFFSNRRRSAPDATLPRRM